MRFTITPNDEEQCFDVRVQRGLNGPTESHYVTTQHLFDWLKQAIRSEQFGELVLDTQAVDTPEPRYLVVEA